MIFDRAYLVGFWCPECGKPMDHANDGLAMETLTKAEAILKSRCMDIMTRCDICKARASAE